ncbi:hypothetical protein LSO9J_120023 [Candidatus Liberibacter solanacearum]
MDAKESRQRATTLHALRIPSSSSDVYMLMVFDFFNEEDDMIFIIHCEKIMKKFVCITSIASYIIVYCT